MARHVRGWAGTAEREGWTFGQYLHTSEAEVEERIGAAESTATSDESELPRREDAGDPRPEAARPQGPAKQLPTVCEGDLRPSAAQRPAFGLPGRGKTHVSARSATS
jgi:hypothetical protein